MRVQSKSAPNSAPALDVVVTVPGPIKAAEMIDQKKILDTPFENLAHRN